jgi:hypothetical protein
MKKPTPSGFSAKPCAASRQNGGIATQGLSDCMRRLRIVTVSTSAPLKDLCGS